MTINVLGEVKKVDLLKVWKKGVPDFTSWLAKKENLDLLAKEIDLEMNLIEMEANISGKFSADILAEDKSSKRRIIIENQFKSTEVSGNECLGNLITYALALDAHIAIWIVEEEQEEHCRTIDWLNEHMNEEFSFFLVRVEVWKINNSSVAAQFKAIAKPKGWTSKPANEVTKTGVQHLLFWEHFNAYAADHSDGFQLQNIGARNWAFVGVGSKHARLLLKVNTLEETIRVEISIISKGLYCFLKQRKPQIERGVGLSNKLRWLELSGGKIGRIYIEFPGQINNASEWDRCCQWLLTTAERFQKVFSKHVVDYRYSKGFDEEDDRSNGMPIAPLIRLPARALNRAQPRANATD